VVLIAAAIVNNFFDSLVARAFSNCFSHDFCGSDISAAFDGLFHFAIERTGRSERSAALIVHNLRANVLGRAMHAKARPLRRSRQGLTRAHVNPSAMRFPR
jgi:hypothetical protein